MPKIPSQTEMRRWIRDLAKTFERDFNMCVMSHVCMCVIRPQTWW
jgi:hypothetical protein